MYADLHQPLLPIVRHVLRRAALPQGGLCLDIGAGNGEKLPLWHEAFGASAQIIGVDNDRALRHPAPALCADAHALPLRDGCCDVALCVAALGLFGDPTQAVREMRRTVRPGGTILLVTATTCWAEVRRWPLPLAAALEGAYAAALAAGNDPLPANQDISGDLARTMADGGCMLPIYAFLLDDSLLPAATELALLPWPALRPLVAPWLSADLLRQCDDTTADIDLCSVALCGLR